jgi:hypothetical protein
MRLLGLYDVQRTKVGVVAVSLAIEQIYSAPTTLLPLLTFSALYICTQVFLQNLLAEWGLMISMESCGIGDDPSHLQTV